MDSAKSGVKRGGGSESGSTSRDWQASQAWAGVGGRSRLAAVRRADSEAERPGSMVVEDACRGAGGKAATAGKGWGGDGWGEEWWGALPTLTGEGSPVKVMET